MPICTAFVLATTKAPKNRRSQVRGPALPEIGAARTIHPVDRVLSCTQGNEVIPKRANEHGLKTLIGAWLTKEKEK